LGSPDLGLFYLSLEWLWETIEWHIESWFRWVVFTFAGILFGYACLVSENSGFILLFGLALTLRGIHRDRSLLTGLGLILLLTKPQATLLMVLCLALWLLRRKPTALAWAASWVLGLLTVATLAIPRWWQFDTSNFGQGLTQALNGPGVVTGTRLAATVYDWLKYTYGIQGIARWTIASLFWLAGGALVYFTWKRHPDPVYLTAASLILTLLVTPYALQYDYVPLSLPFLLTLKHLPDLGSRKRVAVIAPLVASTILLFLAKFQYQSMWILLFVSIAFAISVFSNLPIDSS